MPGNSDTLSEILSDMYVWPAARLSEKLTNGKEASVTCRPHTCENEYVLKMHCTSQRAVAQPQPADRLQDGHEQGARSNYEACRA